MEISLLESLWLNSNREIQFVRRHELEMRISLSAGVGLVYI